MTINNRFQSIIDTLYNGNNAAFAKAIGVSPTVIQNVVGARQGKPSFDVVVKVCANANVDARWLLLGDGEMVRSAEAQAHPENTPSALVIDLMNRIQAQAEEIGELRERIRQLESNRDSAHPKAASKTMGYGSSIHPQRVPLAATGGDLLVAEP